MKEVKIYIETSLRGPCMKDGWYAAMIECQTAKGPATIGLAGMERETTYYRTTLIAVVKALRKLKPCKAIIYTYCSYIKGMYEQGNLERWHRTEWKKSAGGDIENKELWQQFFDEVKRMGGEDKIEFRFSKHHDYREKLIEMMEENKKKAKESESKTA